MWEKARNLKKRVANYTHPAKQPYRLQRMIAETVSMEFVTTHTEVEALLLEANLINQLGRAIMSYCETISRFPIS